MRALQLQFILFWPVSLDGSKLIEQLSSHVSELKKQSIVAAFLSGN